MCVCVCVCVRACVRACVRVCVYGPRIVSVDKILQFVNTSLIINHYSGDLAHLNPTVESLCRVGGTAGLLGPF